MGKGVGGYGTFLEITPGRRGRGFLFNVEMQSDLHEPGR